MDGRFLSRDTFAGYNNSSQSQNRFAYTQNNPIRYIDPTGHYGWDDFITEAKSLINDPVGHTLAQIQKNRNLPWQCTDVGQIAMWAAPAIAPLVIVAAIPIILVSPDSMVDLAFLAYDSYIGDSQAFALDAAALLIPGVMGLGALSRADDAYGLMRYSDEVVQYSDETVAYADEIAVGGCPPVNSFNADTTVVTDEGDTPIAQIKIGDFVLAWDEKTGEISFHPVTDTIHHTDKTIVHLTIDGEEITTTPEHPFYVEGEGWVDAKDLQIGDDLRNADGGTGEVEEITTEQTTEEMYNLTVDQAHTFYVGDGQWLVHNACRNLLGELTNDPLGNELVSEAKAYLNNIDREYRRTVIAVGQGDGKRIVTAWVGTRKEGLQQLEYIATNSGADFIWPIGIADAGHAEQNAYRALSEFSDVNIGISRKLGACEECGKFFKDRNFFYNFFYPE